MVIIHHGTILAQGNIEEIKSMSIQLYTLELTVLPTSNIDTRWMKRWDPISCKQTDHTFIVTFKNQNQILEIVHAVQQEHALQSFEITRASLEDAFIELIDKREVTKR